MATPAYLKTFRVFVGTTPDFSHLPAMEQEFYLGPDRPAVILQASSLETLVRSLILTKMRQPISSETIERMFGGNGPLSSFSHKIMIGHALGLYGPVYRHDLDIIRELRNGFAHVRLPMALETPAIAGMCKHLKLPDMPGNMLPYAYSEKFDLKIVTDETHPRTRFTRSCHTIALRFIELGQYLSGLPGGIGHTLP
ncbi:MAG TPA: hypothetical protein VH020_15955 [Stellaceae bacterium]|nr:hypothetical protein [Stellaceae bacterium]